MAPEKNAQAEQAAQVEQAARAAKKAAKAAKAVPDHYLRYERRNVPDSSLIPARNYYTAQAALVRGAKVATLHNADDLPADLKGSLRVLAPEGRAHWAKHNWGWPKTWKPRTQKEPKPTEVQNLIPWEGWDGFKLKWLTILGEGGLGLATLWEVTFEDGERMKVVIKMGRPGHSSFSAKDEGCWQARYPGASHTVQIVDISAIVDSKRRKSPQMARFKGQPFIPLERNVLVLEYLTGGSLRDLCIRLSTEQKTPPIAALYEAWVAGTP